jgi:hypothetical protein
MYTTRSNPYTEDGDSNHGATTKQNGIFEIQMRAWMNALSPEGRAAALSVKDSAFLFTLMHFASMSSSCGHTSDGAVAGNDGECTIPRELVSVRVPGSPPCDVLVLRVQVTWTCTSSHLSSLSAFCMHADSAQCARIGER